MISGAFDELLLSHDLLRPLCLKAIYLKGGPDQFQRNLSQLLSKYDPTLWKESTTPNTLESGALRKKVLPRESPFVGIKIDT